MNQSKYDLSRLFTGKNEKPVFEVVLKETSKKTGSNKKYQTNDASGLENFFSRNQVINGAK